MRRLLILFYWVFKSSNNVSFKEMFQFLVKPRVDSIAKKYIEAIVEGEQYFEIRFKNSKKVLFWPRSYGVSALNQVVTETFDRHDWHFYQKSVTPIQKNDIVLDVGAAEGLFALDVVDQCEKLILIEPNDIFNEALEKTFQPYKSKVKIWNVAVGNHEGEIVFNETSLSGKIKEDGEGSKKKIFRIDTLIPASEKITFLKADLEGFEMEMLKGAVNTIKRNLPRIAITSYHTENDADQIISLIKGIDSRYNFYKKGVFHEKGKPVMIHFWI